MRTSGIQRTTSLARALALPRRGAVAFVGAGGKTSAIARLLSERPQAVATTTTHLARHGFARGALAVCRDMADLRAVEAELLRHAPITLALRGDEALRIGGPDLAWQESFARRHPSTLLLVEADGAAGRDIKLPGPHEPAWCAAPLRSAVIVVGCRAWGHRLADVAHHPERFEAHGVGARTVGTEHLAAMLSHYVHAMPPEAAVRVLLCGTDAMPNAALAELAEHAMRLVRQRDPLWNDPNVAVRVVAQHDAHAEHDRQAAHSAQTAHTAAYTVWYAAARPRSRRTRLAGVCGVLLAAGLGRRFASDVETKLLARWRGRSLVAHAVRRWSAAGFAELVVVTGHAATAVEREVRHASPLGTRLRIVRNARYARGLGSSVRTAARHATPGMALVFGHADMPAVRRETLMRIASLGRRLRHRIVVPLRAGQPANPVYFPPTMQSVLRRVPEGRGGRSVYRAHRDLVFELDVGAGADLVDIDRVDDLQRL